MIVLALLTALAKPAPETPPAAGAWAIGFAAEVERACPAWRRVPQHEMARRGLLFRETPITDWAPDGPLHAAYWRGWEAAERDRAARADFCVDPARSPGAALVRRALERVPGTTPPPRD